MMFYQPETCRFNHSKLHLCLKFYQSDEKILVTKQHTIQYPIRQTCRIHLYQCPENRVTLPCETWIPRIRLRFFSENPWIFVKRVAEAFEARKACEAGLRCNLYVDCMPTYGIEDVDKNSFKRMSHFAMSTPGLKDKERYVGLVS